MERWRREAERADDPFAHLEADREAQIVAMVKRRIEAAEGVPDRGRDYARRVVGDMESAIRAGKGAEWYELRSHNLANALAAVREYSLVDELGSYLTGWGLRAAVLDVFGIDPKDQRSCTTPIPPPSTPDIGNLNTPCGPGPTSSATARTGGQDTLL